MEVKINELPELTDPSGSHIVGYKGNGTVQIPTDAVVSKAQEIISDAYSATKAYTIGEYCIYNNSLYKCIANTSAGITPTNSTYWTNTSVSEELASNARAKESVVAAVNEIVERLAADEESLEPLNYDGAGAHNAIYRGKNLGTAFTAAQSAAIRDGSFKDLYIGDYWTINGTVYRIADFDYFLKSGDTECTAHHAVIVPDVSMDTQKMNDTNVTTGAYVGSKMYTTNMATAKAKIKADFGSTHILAHREYLANAVANGKQSAGAWYDSEIELMTEQMVYGGSVFAPGSDGSTIPALFTIGCKQLNLFRHRPDLISNRQTYWFRDVATATRFAYVAYDGYASYNDASAAYGVRPAFPIH